MRGQKRAGKGNTKGAEIANAAQFPRRLAPGPFSSPITMINTTNIILHKCRSGWREVSDHTTFNFSFTIQLYLFVSQGSFAFRSFCTFLLCCLLSQFLRFLICSKCRPVLSTQDILCTSLSYFLSHKPVNV